VQPHGVAEVHRNSINEPALEVTWRIAIESTSLDSIQLVRDSTWLEPIWLVSQQLWWVTLDSIWLESIQLVCNST
jgi:hypothetical protein